MTKNNVARQLYQDALEKQWGRERDTDAAVPLYRASSDLGFAGAQNNLGDLYDRGYAVSQSDIAAVYWYTRAAERGEPTAYLSLASIMSKGQADEALLIEALKFSILAHSMLPEGGNKDLAQLLKCMLMVRLSEEACCKAYELVKDWEPLFQEEYLLSDSPAFAGLAGEHIQNKKSGNRFDGALSLDLIWHYCTSNKRVIPKNWEKFYQMLSNKRQLPSGAWEPSLPLILAAWHETSPLDKQLRFREHVEWAYQQGQMVEIDAYLRSLSEEDWYHFGEL